MKTIMDKDLLSIQEARILAENAAQAHQLMLEFSQEQLDKIVDRMVSEIAKYIDTLAEMSVEETDYGRKEDKILKDKFVCGYMVQQIKDMKCVGFIKRDYEAMTMDIGVPVGVIAAALPATNPVSTTIYKALIAIKAGNAIVFSPHPRAIRTTSRTLDILIDTAKDAGLPEGAMSYLHTVTKQGVKELIYHKDVNLIMLTGVPKILKLASHTNKPVLYGSAGNGPAFIERTADIKQAVSDIIASKTFDYGISAAVEQSVIVDGEISDMVEAEFIRQGAYFMTDQEADTLGHLLFNSDGSIDPEMVGKSATYLAKHAGISVPEGTVLLIARQKYVSNESIYSKERLCPVLAYYVEHDWHAACETCMELLVIRGNTHTLVIHSHDNDVIEKFALKRRVARVLVNTPAAFGGMGMTTNLFPALTLGSGLSGEGFATDNISPMNLVHIRKVGFGVRNVQDFLPDGIKNVPKNPSQNTSMNSIQIEDLQKLVRQLLAENKN